MTLTTEDADAIRILLERYNEHLSEWEVQFLESVGDQDWISEKQKETLDKIWERTVSR
jgi:hypothetical protein